MAIGALGMSLNNTNFPLPSCAIDFRRSCWIVTNDYININGRQMQSKFGEVLEQIEAGCNVTLTFTHTGNLGNTFLIINTYIIHI